MVPDNAIYYVPVTTLTLREKVDHTSSDYVFEYVEQTTAETNVAKALKHSKPSHNMHPSGLVTRSLSCVMSL